MFYSKWLQTPRLTRRFLLSLFWFALTVRVFYIVFATDNTTIGTWYDSGANIALSLLKGDGYVSSWEVCRDFQSYRTPVLPFTLYAIWSVFGVNILLAKIVMAVFSALTCVFLALLAARIFDVRVGVATGIAAALCTSFIRWSGTLGAETLTLFFLATATYLFSSTVMLPTTQVLYGKRFLLCGFLFGLLCLTRPIWLPYLLLLVVAFLICKRDLGSLKQVLVICVGVSLVMTPWIIRNAVVHRTVVVASTEGGIAFLEANNPISFAGKGDWATHFAANQPEIQRASRRLPEAAFDRFMLRKGLSYIADDPRNFVRVYFIRLGYLWQPSPPPQLAGDLSSKHIALLTLWWGTLTALMIAAFVKHKPWNRVEHWPLLLLLLWGSLIIPLFSSQLRYRAPLEAFILIYGVAGFFTVCDWWKTQNKTRNSASAIVT